MEQNIALLLLQTFIIIYSIFFCVQIQTRPTVFWVSATEQNLDQPEKCLGECHCLTAKKIVEISEQKRLLSQANAVVSNVPVKQGCAKLIDFE